MLGADRQGGAHRLRPVAKVLFKFRGREIEETFAPCIGLELPSPGNAAVSSVRAQTLKIALTASSLVESR